MKSKVERLVELHLWPATPHSPRVAFTMDLLDLIHAAMLECQVSLHHASSMLWYLSILRKVSFVVIIIIILCCCRAKRKKQHTSNCLHRFLDTGGYIRLIVNNICYTNPSQGASRTSLTENGSIHLLHVQLAQWYSVGIANVYIYVKY